MGLPGFCRFVDRARRRGGKAPRLENIPGGPMPDIRVPTGGMPLIYLGFLLHIYQPPNQFDHVFKQIVEECYRPLFDLINSRDDSAFTFNINWSLTEGFLNRGFPDVVDSIRYALDTGRIEVTGTAAYHAILPLIPPDERIRQILVNSERSREVYGDSYRPRGLFPPEMAFGHEIVKNLKDLGIDWTITEDIPFNCIHNEVPFNYVASQSGLPILLRSSMWSNKISMQSHPDGTKFNGEELAEWLISGMESWFGGNDGYIVLAMDGETFGHHIKGYVDMFLRRFLDYLDGQRHRINMVQLSDLVDGFPVVEKEVPPGSWSTGEHDFWEGNFFPLWKSAYNQTHKLLWELTDLALEGVKTLQEKLDRSLNSCTFWWAGMNSREISPITSRGMDMLIDVIRVANPNKLDHALAIKTELEHRIDKRPLQHVPREDDFWLGL